MRALKNELNNQRFVDNAPTEIVDQEKKKLTEAEEMLKKMSK
ncbi:hypothetical protein K8R66_00770 [bacterium]|nr:hypothetical protein [bacterium]